MSFIHDVKKVISKLPPERQTLFFPTTMPQEISRFADTILDNPVRAEVTPVSSTAEKVEQGIYFVKKETSLLCCCTFYIMTTSKALLYLPLQNTR